MADLWRVGVVVLPRAVEVVLVNARLVGGEERTAFAAAQLYPVDAAGVQQPLVSDGRPVLKEEGAAV